VFVIYLSYCTQKLPQYHKQHTIGSFQTSCKLLFTVSSFDNKETGFLKASLNRP
jgi:hypothetical protein